MRIFRNIADRDRLALWPELPYLISLVSVTQTSFFSFLSNCPFNMLSLWKCHPSIQQIFFFTCILKGHYNLQIWSGFFAYAGRLPSVTEISRNNLAKNWPESLARWLIRCRIWQNMYQNRKMPDKSSRLSAAFVRHLMQFKRKTFFRLFFIAIPLWQSFLQQLFQLCPRSLDQCCKQLMRLRNKAQPIPTCCWSETLQKESTRTMLNLLTKSQQISSFLKPPNNYIVILSRFWIN